MPNYQLTHEGKTHEFAALQEAQEFLDKLPSRAGVEILEAPQLFRLLNAPGAPLTNWRDINAEICKEFSHARTEDQRVALLAGFKASMDVAETTVPPESLKVFQEARTKQYKTFIVEEALVGSNVCVETLYAVTQREIDAGRMAPDDSLRKTAEMGMATPHLSRAELLAQTSVQPSPARPNLWKRFLGWLRGG